MTVRRWTLGCGLAALLAASYLANLHFNRKLASGAAARGGGLKTGSNTQIHRERNKTDAPAERVIRINAAGILGSVNGRELKLADLLPLNPAQKTQVQELSAATYNFLLDRAVNRELIFQTAKAQGIALDDSQREQLAEFRRQRNQREPGLVQNLNAAGNQVDFEARDAEAFMLQTALLAKAGASPDVTAEEAMEYYRQHSTEYAGLPADEPARSQAWAEIEFQIRTSLAPAKRTKFQSQLSAYMDQMKSVANVALSPVTQSDLPSSGSSAP